MNIRSLNKNPQEDFYKLSRLNELLDTLASNDAEKRRNLLGTSYGVGPQLDLVLSIYNPSLPYAEKLVPLITFLLDEAYKNDPDDAISVLILRAAQDEKKRPFKLMPEIFGTYIKRYEHDRGTDETFALLKKINRKMLDIEGYVWAYGARHFLPLLMEYKDKNQSVAQQFFTFFVRARYGVDENMAQRYEQFRDMESHEELRRYSYSKARELMPQLEEKAQSKVETLTVLEALTQFYTAQTPLEMPEAEKKDIDHLLNVFWVRHFDTNEGSPHEFYKAAKLEHVSSFKNEKLLNKMENLSARIARTGEPITAANLAWAVALSYPAGSPRQKMALRSLNTAISTMSGEHADDLFTFCVKTMRELTRVSDDIPRSALAWLSQESTNPDDVPPEEAAPIPAHLNNLAKTMLGIMEERADSLLKNNPKEGAELLMLMARFLPEGTVERNRYIKKMNETLARWSETAANEEHFIHFVNESFEAVHSQSDIGRILTQFRSSQLAQPLTELHQQVAEKLTALPGVLARPVTPQASPPKRRRRTAKAKPAHHP